MKLKDKIRISLFAFCNIYVGLFAQQEAQYTQYMYNPLSINPAYAGSRDMFSFTGLYRSQWVGLDGAPRTMTGSFHSPVSDRVGLGLNFINDEIFISKQTYVDIDFSYAIDVSRQGRFAFGLKAGLDYLDLDSNRAANGASNPVDPNAMFVEKKLSPQVGVGFFYYSDNFFLGLSAPNLLETEHFDVSNTNSTQLITKRIHYYLYTGYIWDLNDNLKFKPSVLAKAVAGAPLQLDVSANFLVNDRLTLGAAYRWGTAVSALVGFQVSHQIMLGFGYDRETTPLAQFNQGSFEFLLQFDLKKKRGKILCPRFF